MGKRTRGILRYLVGVIVAAMLIRWVIQSSGADLRQEFRECDPGYITLAFFLFGVGISLGTFRWAKLLEVQGVVLTAWEAVRFTMIGIFFNVVAPGGVGGDGAKMVYISERAGPRAAEAILSILVDRILGLLGLFLVAIGAVAANWQFLEQAPQKIQATVLSVFAASICGFVAVGVAAYHDRLLSIPRVNGWANYLASHSPKRLAEVLGRVGLALVLYRRHPWVVALAIGQSVVIHCCTALALCCVGLGVHAVALGLRDYFLAIQIANTVSAVPIFPGGLGGRDVVLKVFFEAVGEGPKAGVIPTILSMLVILWSLCGGVVFMLAGGESAREKAGPQG